MRLICLRPPGLSWLCSDIVANGEIDGTTDYGNAADDPKNDSNPVRHDKPHARPIGYAAYTL